MAKIKDFINNNYTIKGKLTFEHVNGICVVNCDDDVIVQNRDIQKLTDGFVWGEVEGDFDCSYCTNLISLEGAPTYVEGNFICDCCNSQLLWMFIEAKQPLK